MIQIRFYAPEGVSLMDAPIAAYLDKKFDGTEVQVSKGEKPTPCVLAVITDTDSVAFQS